MASSNHIREVFLEYFERNGHRVVPSSSLIPFNDKTLLFSNAGMNQFKDVFLGKEDRPYRRAATSQKCMRVSGKQNDLKDVGHSTRHHTFFEMLGNFSFGDYFKKDAIRFAWELLTRDMGIDPARLWITIFRDDDEAYGLWHRDIGIPAGKIYRLGEKDNFWAMGDTGPCGPCSELHYDFGKSPLAGHPDCDLTCSCGRWVEVWNLVFMQFNRDESGSMIPLPSPSIDTGMGLERVTTILQGKSNNYETDLFRPLLQSISEITGAEYGADPNDDVSMRIIADHARAAAFVIADGQYPGNDKRGYVLRKIMRRAVVHGKKLKIQEPFIYRIAGRVGEMMGGAYPELVAGRDTISRVIKQEEEAFADTLELGLRDFEDRSGKFLASGSRTFPGEEAFYLYDTRGLPFEIIDDLAQEKGLVVDEAAFTRALEQQRERSRQDYHTGKVRETVVQTVFAGKTTFVGYEYSAPLEVNVKAIIIDGDLVENIEAGQAGEIFLDPTPFYPEAGGQVGDCGTISRESTRAKVLDTIYRGTAIAHVVEMITGSLQVGDVAVAEIDLIRRSLTMKNHTATHLLHAALRKTLGPHVKQAGSLVAPDRLRFDFTHYAPLTEGEIDKLEDEVNEEIWRNKTVRTRLMDLEEAMNSGAMALFGEKYQEKVRVVEVPGFSRELCGGTHVPATGMIGSFKVLSESGIAAGVRRIEGITGPAAMSRFRSGEKLLDCLQFAYKVTRAELPAYLERLHGQLREMQRQVADLKTLSARSALGEILEKTREVLGVKVLACKLPETDRAGLRSLADELRQKLGSGVVVLGTPQEGKAALVVMVSPDLCRQLPAGKIVKGIAPLINGAGGGKAELAEAGGKDSSKLDDAIERSYGIIESMLRA